MTSTDGDARQVASTSPDVGLFANPHDRLRVSAAAAVCPSASWTEKPTKRRAVNLNQTTHTFEQPRMQIRKAAPAPHSALVALSKSIKLDPTLRELVNLRASIINGCAYCIDTHSKDARQTGESEQRLYALSAWRDSPLFSDDERAVLALTDAITLISDEHVPRAVWDEAAALFSEDELAQLLWAITAMNAWNRIAIATRMESPYERPPYDRTLTQAASR